MLVYAVLAAVHATPLPDVVQNFPGPDKVATDTLAWAKAAVFVSVIVGGVSLWFGWADYRLIRRQFAQPDLMVRDELTIGMALRRTALKGEEDDNDRYAVGFKDFTLVNKGKRASNGCYVAFYIPEEYTFSSPHDNWRRMSLPEQFPHGRFTRCETFISEPVFLDHPLMLPEFYVSSTEPIDTFKLGWRIFYEEGRSPRDNAAFYDVKVDKTVDAFWAMEYGTTEGLPDLMKPTNAPDTPH